MSLFQTPEVAEAIALIWQAMGLPAPLEEIGARYDFDLDDTPLELSRRPDGSGLLLEARLGLLSADSHAAREQLARLLHLSLVMSVANRAVLILPAGGAEARLAALGLPDSPPEPVLVQLAFPRPAEAVEALREVMQWRDQCRGILDAPQPAGAEEMPGLAPASEAADVAGEMIIFQP